MSRFLWLVFCLFLAATTFSDHSLAQPAGQSSPVELKTSEPTGLPEIYPYHGMILNHDLQPIPLTEENLRNLLEHYLDAVARRSKSSADVSAIRVRVRDRGEASGMEALLGLNAAYGLLETIDASDRSQYLSMLRVIETWASSNKATKQLLPAKSDPKFLSAAKDLNLVINSDGPPAAPDTYIETCKSHSVPIPPDWGAANWTFVGVLDRKYTFSAGADGPTEVWAAADVNVKGVCLALPRKDLATSDIVLLGIICQSKVTGKACFWDNIDRKTGDRLTGDAIKNMKIADIQDGNLLSENCTNCHRGYNAFPIHPGTTLDLGGKYELEPDKRYEPISGQATWGNPGPLVQQGEAPCGSCHEIPALKDNNNTGPLSSYCKTVLQKAANLTMPYIGSPANWDNPKPAYKTHIEFLKGRCAPEALASK